MGDRYRSALRECVVEGGDVVTLHHHHHGVVSCHAPNNMRGREGSTAIILSVIQAFELEVKDSKI